MAQNEISVVAKKLYQVDGVSGEMYETDNISYILVERDSLDALIGENLENKARVAAGMLEIDSPLQIDGNQIEKAFTVKGDKKSIVYSKASLEALLKEVSSLRRANDALMRATSNKKQITVRDSSSKEVEDLKKQIEELKSKSDDSLVQEIERLKRENENLRLAQNSEWGTSEELTKLRAIVNAYEERRANNRKAREGSLSKARQKGLEVRQHKSREQTARILVLTLKGYSVREVISVMYEDYSAEVKQGNIYRLLSVKEDTDRERILSIYDDFKDLFKDITKEELISWFNSERINKLHLISKEQLIRRIGIDEFNAKCLIPDEYVDGEYYKI